MGNLADYFEKNAYKPKYEIGDRVYGTFSGVPFIGTVGNDRVVGLDRGPEVTIHLDLPMRIDKDYKTVIIVKHKDIKSRLQSLEDTGPLKLKEAGSIPAKRTKPKGTK